MAGAASAPALATAEIARVESVSPPRSQPEPLAPPRAEPAPKPALESAPTPLRHPEPGRPGADPQLWTRVVERMRGQEPRWAAMYEHGVPQEISRERVTVAFPEGSFFGRQAQTPAGTEALRRAAHEALAAAPEIVIKLAMELRGRSLAQQEAAQLDERKEGIKKRALTHPRVLEALKVFPELAQKQEIQVD
jgi:hypothetical protein